MRLLRSMRMNRRTFAAALAVAASSCGSKKQHVVGIVPKGATQMFWQAVHAGAIETSRGYGLEIVWNAPAQESDRSRQVAIVEAMINRGVDGLALAPVDRRALVSAVDRAVDRGIPVVVFDSELDSDRITSYVATDNREAGRMAARRMGAVLGGKGKVAILDDMPGSASTGARVEGFEAECAARFSAIVRLPVQFVMGDRAKARAVTENLLSAHPDLAGIFADHENATIGAALALRARENRGLRLAGFDSSEQLIENLRDGWIDSLVVQNPFRMGQETVRALGERLAGRTPARVLDTGSTLVLRESLEKPEVRELLMPDLKRWLG